MKEKTLTFQEQVWTFMRAQNRPVSIPEIRQRFKCTRERANRAVWHLVESKGSAVRVGSGRGCRYMATRFRPYDTRGLAPATYEALRRHSFPAFDGYWPKSKLNPINQDAPCLTANV